MFTVLRTCQMSMLTPAWLIVLSQKNFTSIMLENQIFVEIHWPAEGCDESRKNGG
jgi:hypothetical protein